MRATLNIPDQLINDLMAELGIKNKTRIISLSLEEMLKRVRRTRLKSMRGKLKLDLNLSEIRGREMI